VIQFHWKVVDVSRVPDKYVQRMVIGYKVDFAVYNGVRDIPGIEIMETEDVSGGVKSER
jgi:hypothetical protein